MILADKCLELSLPEPHQTEEQLHYVKRIIAEGYSLNTRVCRLLLRSSDHSFSSMLFKFCIAFEWVNSPAYGAIVVSGV